MKKLHPAVVYVLAIILGAGAIAALAPRAYARDSLPPVTSQEGCMAMADFAISARAMLAADIEPQKIATALSTMYPVPNDGDARLYSAILNKAKVDSRSPGEFSKQLLFACLSTQGDLTEYLGPGI